MLDTIIYIPTILAYIFITLLVVILCFITIYVSHKIFICIFDTLPVSRTPSLIDSAHTPPSDRRIARTTRMASIKSYDSSVAALFLQDQLPARKAKTALRIIVTLEPCYVAYVTFVYTAIKLAETPSPPPPPPSRQSLEPGRRPSSSVRITESNVIGKKLVKYYDRLSEIPLGKVMRVCAPDGDERSSDQSTTLDAYQRQEQQEQQQQRQQQRNNDDDNGDDGLLFKDMFRATRYQSLSGGGMLPARLVAARRPSRL